MVSLNFVVALLLVVALLAVGLWGLLWVMPRAVEEDAALGWMALIVSVGIVLVTVVSFGYGLYPYRWEYHSYKPVTGVATEDVESRLLGGDGGPTEYFLVSVADGRYRCEDTRCATIKKGDRVALSCIKEWIYSGTDAWRCRFVSVE